MPIEHRIRQLVEEALDSDRTPDEVCRDCPELLGEVRGQWERVRAIEAEMEALFPGPDGPSLDDAAFRDEETGLPRIEGYDVEAVVAFLEGIEDGRRHMIVPATEIVPGDDDRRAFPFRRHP